MFPSEDQELLLEAVDELVAAVLNKGSHPEYHDRIVKQLQEMWPTLSEKLWRVVEAHCRLNNEKFKGVI
jgi:hypothetical protein